MKEPSSKIPLSVQAAQAPSPEAFIAYALERLYQGWAQKAPGRPSDLMGRHGVQGHKDAVAARVAAKVDAAVTGLLDRGADLGAEVEDLLDARDATTGLAAAQVVTSTKLNRLFASVLEPASNIFDPACGHGGTLTALATPETRVLGADTNPEACFVADLRLSMLGVKDAEIELRDSLLRPPAERFDLVVCQPPLNTQLTTREVNPNLLRQVPETGRTVDGSAAWLALVASSVTETGQGALVMPPASTSNRTQLAAVRRRLLEEGRLQAVIALPPGFILGSETGAFLWIISGQRDPRKEDRVLMVSAAALLGDDQERCAEVGQLVRQWSKDAVLGETPDWVAGLVPAQELITKGFAPQLHLALPPEEARSRPTPAGRLLTSLTLQNFKSVEAKQTIPLRPLTLLYGQNSAGKSSLIQSLLLLRQSLRAGRFKPDGAEDLGSLAGLLHGHDLSAVMKLGVTFASSPTLDSRAGLPDPGQQRLFQLEFAYPQTSETGMPTELVLGLGENTFDFNYQAPDYVLGLGQFKHVVRLLESQNLLYGPGTAQKKPTADPFEGVSPGSLPPVSFVPNGIGIGGLDKDFLSEVQYRTSGSAFHRWALEQLSDVSSLFGAISDEALVLADRMVYLGPLRQAPRRSTTRSTAEGSFDTPFHLLDNPSEQTEVSKQLNRLGINYDLTVVNPVAPELRETLGEVASLLLTDRRSGVVLTPADVGFGISQVLPIVTELSARRSSVIMVEQPEIHLHPAMQSELADIFIESVDESGRANQVIIETHSETLILRIQRRIREQVISAGDVLVLYIDQDAEGRAHIQELRLGADGEFLDHWPGGFFDEQFSELFGD